MQECNFSFNDLFSAYAGRNMSAEEKQRFNALPQEEKNIKVRQWAAQAGFKTEDRRGQDGLIYTAFWKELE
jgi:hypothetical protein